MQDVFPNINQLTENMEVSWWQDDKTTLETGIIVEFSIKMPTKPLTLSQLKILVAYPC